MSSTCEHEVAISADITCGTHVLHAVQNHRNVKATIPKATIYVGPLPDPAPESEVRAGSSDVRPGPSGVSLILLGLGAAGGGLLLVGALTVLAGSRRSTPQADP